MPDKPVILFFQFNLMSHFFRALRVAVTLKENYTVLMQNSPDYTEWLEKFGIASFECNDFDARDVLKRLGSFDFSWLNQKNLESILKDQVRMINHYRPDLVVGDTSFTLKMAAECTSVPYVSILNGYSTKYYRFTRKLSPKHPVAPFIDWLPHVLLNPMVKLGEEWNFWFIKKQFNQVRRKYNLNPSRHYFNELEGTNNLICDLPEIFPQKNLPNRFSFVGPLFFQNQLSSDLIISRLCSFKKTILVTLGSSGEWKYFNFLNDEVYSIYNIVVVGRQTELNAPFLIKADFLNFDTILPHTDLVICHGGNGTLYKALQHKIPVLGFPSHLEQCWNMNRIEQLGYGLSIEKIKPPHYPAIIQKWITQKNTIHWQLNFKSFAKKKQDTLILQVITEVLKK